MKDILNDQDLILDAAIAYNSRRLARFDATFGDGGCQGRALIILPLIQEYPQFQGLPPDKQEFLKLCYILQPKVYDLLDEIGILVKESEGSISELRELSISNRSKVIKEMSKRLGQMTIDLITERAIRAGLTNLLANLGTTTIRGIPSASSYTEIQMAFQICIDRNIPILIKLRRLEYNAYTQTFLCSIVELLQLNYTGALAPNTPALVVESYSMKSDQGAEALTADMASVNTAQNFEEYIERLNLFGLFRAIELGALIYDAYKGIPVPLEQQQNPMNFNQDYADKTARRKAECAPFTVLHVYPSTIRVELLDITAAQQYVGREFRSQCILSERVV